MIRHRFEISFIASVAAMLGMPQAQGADAGVPIQANISAAKIVASNNRYVVDISIMASDIERMFMKAGGERVGVNLSQPGALEREIGKFVGRRVAMRDHDGAACAKSVEPAGEDPGNDEAVRVVLNFECAGGAPTYDVTELLATQSPRAWQVVTIIRGDSKRQVMVHGESPPVGVSAPK
jgi:hypothetical protein